MRSLLFTRTNSFTYFTCLLISVIFTLVLQTLFSHCQAQTYKLVVGPAAGYLQPDKDGAGDKFLSAIIDELKVANIAIDIQYAPWARADSLFNEGKVDIEFPALLGDRALENALFSAPVSVVGKAIYTHIDDPTINTVDDLANLQGILALPLGHEESFGVSKRFPHLKIDHTPSISANLKKLSIKRIDALIYWKAAVSAELIKENIYNVHHGDIFDLSFGCFAVRGSHGPKLLTEINKAIGKLLVNGQYQAIMHSNSRSLLPSH